MVCGFTRPAGLVSRTSYRLWQWYVEGAMMLRLLRALVQTCMSVPHQPLVPH